MTRAGSAKSASPHRRPHGGSGPDLGASTQAETDVGCGTGYLLGQLAARAPQAEALAGIDAASAMIEAARGRTADGPLLR